MRATVDVMSKLMKEGVLLESARGPLPNVAELVAGSPIKGSWWGHPSGHAIYAELNALDESPDVARMRLVNGKVTLVHRRLWPALVRAAERFTPKQLAVLLEEHTSSGAHRVMEVPFPKWVPEDVAAVADLLSLDEALAELPDCLRR
jgi:hypothetical protein